MSNQQLPVFKTPSYELTIPSTKKKVKYRPFLVKEEKILLLVKESSEPSEMLRAMKDVIISCTFNAVDPEVLSVFDIEYIFLQLRAKSIGENVDIAMRCTNKVFGENPADGPHECKNSVLFNINISKINVVFPEGHSNIVQLDDNIGITFKYPTLDTALQVEKGDDEFTIAVDLVDNIFDANNVYDAKDIDKSQITEFIDNLSHDQYALIMKTFFDNMPSLEHTEEYTCSKCGHTGKYTFRGVSDFF